MSIFKGSGITVTGSSRELVTEATAAGFIEVTPDQGDDSEGELCDEPVLSFAEFLTDYTADWADKIIYKCGTGWRSWNTPHWLPKALRPFDWAFLQLPAPDQRFASKSWNGIQVYKASKGWPARGFKYIKELIETGTITHRLEVKDGAGDLVNRNPEEQCASTSGTKVHGLDTQLIDPDTLARFKKLEKRGDFKTKPKTFPDRTDTCAEDFNKHVRSAIDYALKKIAEQDTLMFLELKKSIQLEDGIWKFSKDRGWVTSLTNIPYDCSMILQGNTWEIRFSGKESLEVADSAGIRCTARILACGNVPAPSALIAGGDLLNEFLTIPPYHRLFHAMYRKVEVMCNDKRNGEIERSICRAKNLKPEHSFHATDQLTRDSDLHTICGLPTGFVILDADGLTAIYGRVAKRLALMSADDPNFSKVQRIMNEIGDGIRFSKMYKTLLEQIQPACPKAADSIRQSVHRLRKQLQERRLPRYAQFANYIENNVTTGELCEHKAMLRWKIEGIPLVPDTLELAEDHTQYKFRRTRRLRENIDRAIAAVPAVKPEPSNWQASLRVALKELAVQPNWLSEQPPDEIGA